MGLVLQCQRRAIEGVITQKERPPHPLMNDSLFLPAFLDDGRKLFILGISVGTGTCSDIHGVNVLVMGTGRSQNPIRLPRGATIASCAYAVLLRPSTEEEKKTADNEFMTMAVELLDQLVKDERMNYFCRTGIVAHYTPI